MCEYLMQHLKYFKLCSQDYELMFYVAVYTK